MALVEPTKKGGRYTKKEQVDRKNEVYHLHFEQGYSAVKISEMLDVNRNTINEDIKFWYSELSKEFVQSDINSWLMKQIHRLEAQISRLYEESEKIENPLEKLAYEKLIFDIENKKTQTILKISMAKQSPFTFKKDTDEVSEDEIKNIVRNFIEKYSLHDLSINVSDDVILSHIINMKKCTKEDASRIFRKMLELGLELNRYNDITFDGKTHYELYHFARMREYFTKEEISKRYIEKEKYDLKQEKAEKELDKKLEQLEEKFTEKYGSDKSKWSNEVIEEYDKTEDSYYD